MLGVSSLTADAHRKITDKIERSRRKIMTGQLSRFSDHSVTSMYSKALLFRTLLLDSLYSSQLSEDNRSPWTTNVKASLIHR